MGFLWGKTRCQEVTGWEDRMVSKLTIAGGTGVAVGSVLSVVHQQPMARYTLASTASFLMLAGCFSAVQELSRLVRCRDSPTNSVLGGAATGALLYKTHGQSGVPGAIICAALGGGAHLLSAKVEAAGGLQRLLVSLDLLDPPPEWEAQQAAAAAAAAAQQQQRAEEAPAPRRWWHSLLPVRRMSDREWEEYTAAQDEAQRQRIEAALAGGLPVLVERRRQQQQQQQQQQQRQEGADET